MSYSKQSWTYKDPITIEKLDQMEDNSVWANEHGIFGCYMDITGTSTVKITGGRLAIGDSWLVEDTASVVTLTAETNAHWENGSTQEGSATAWYVVAYASGDGFNCKFRASAPAYSNTESGTSVGAKLYDKTGTTWFRYIGRIWNNSGNAIEKLQSSLIPYKIVQELFHYTASFETGTTVIQTSSTAPINTEGDQFMNLPFLPMSPYHKLFTDVIWNGGCSNATEHIKVCLFRDNIATALAVAAGRHDSLVENLITIPLRYCEIADTGSTIDYKIRAGSKGVGGAVTYFNGNENKQAQGGTTISSIKVTEIGR